jgi:hypothetical protein
MTLPMLVVVAGVFPAALIPALLWLGSLCSAPELGSSGGPLLGVVGWFLIAAAVIWNLLARIFEARGYS